jgi:hypothetical protein
MILPAS